MRRYIFLFILGFSVFLYSEPYKPYPILWVHGYGGSSEDFGESAILLVDDARTPRNIAQEKALKYQILDLDPLLLGELLEKMGIFSQVEILEKEEIDTLYSIPPEERIPYIKEKTKEKYLFSIRVLRYKKEPKEYELSFRYEWLDMEKLEIISSARLKTRFKDTSPIKSIVRAIEKNLKEKKKDLLPSIPTTINPIPKDEVEKFINLHNIGDIRYMSIIFSSSLLYSPSRNQRWKAFALSSLPLYFSAHCEDMFKGDLSNSCMIIGGSLGGILGINSIFWFPEFYSKEPLTEFLQQIGVLISSLSVGVFAGMLIGRNFSLEEEIDGIPIMKKISFSTMLGATCIGDSGWVATAQGRTYIPKKGYFLTISSSSGAFEIDKNIYPFLGVGCGAGWKLEKLRTKILGEIFLTTPYVYTSYGYFQAEINSNLWTFKKICLTTYLRKKIPLSQHILTEFEFWEGTEIGIGFEL